MNNNKAIDKSVKKLFNSGGKVKKLPKKGEIKKKKINAQKRLFRKQLRSLGFTSYSQFLNSKTWREFSKKVRQENNYTNCFSCDKELNGVYDLHHISYSNILNSCNIRAMCRQCHSEVHFMAKNMNPKHDSLGKTTKKHKNIKRRGKFKPRKYTKYKVIAKSW